MILQQTLIEAVNGYWDGGKKQVFEWEIEGEPKEDKQGKFVKIGCWSANYWFHVALGRTDKQTLANAKRHLKASTKIESIFQYI